MLAPVPVGPRLRNAAATRQAMLVSARRHFSRESYENVGLREIAGDAGIDPALVSRYFGSKEQLFKAAVQHDEQDMFAGVTREGLAAHFAELMLESEAGCEMTAAKVEKLLIILRSANSPKASAIIREAIDEDLIGPVAGLLEGEDAELRASLCLAVMMGTGMLRTALCHEPLTAASEIGLRARLTRLFAAALAD
jgi:AcrR family transcriptional regulator